MAITFGGFSGAGSTAIGSVLTWQHTVEDGENRILIVAVSNEGNSTTAPNVNFCTYNGITMTRIVTTQAATTAYVRTTFFELINPPVGTATVRATLVSDSGGISGTSVTMFGAKQQSAETVVSNLTTATGTALSGTVSVVAPNSIIIDCFTSNLGSMPTVNAGQTQVAQSPNASTGNYTTISSKQADAVGDYTHGYTSPSFARAAMSTATYAPSVDAPTDGNNLTVTEFSPSTIFPRIASKADVTFSGTFTGIVPTDIQIQVMSGATIALAYKTLSNMVIGNGVWSGTLTDVPQGGMYKAWVRSRNNADVIFSVIGSNSWGVGAIWALLGSSTPAKWFSDGSITPFARLGIYDNGWRAPSGAGVGANSFASAYATTTGIPIGLVDCGEGGTLLSNWKSSTYSFYQRWVTYLAAVGGRVEGVIIGVGSNDARSSTITSQASHEAGLRQLIANVRSSAANATLPVFLIGSQRAPLETSATDQQFQWARAAELNVADDANNYMGSQTVDLPLASDQVHTSDAGTSVMAKRIAAAALNRLGLRTSGSKGPSPVSALYSGTNIRVTFTVSTGTGIIAKTPSSPITGFEVSTDNFATLVTISAASVVSPTEIDLTVPSGLIAPKVRYLYGRIPSVTNPVYDNGSFIA